MTDNNNRSGSDSDADSDKYQRPADGDQSAPEHSIDDHSITESAPEAEALEQFADDVTDTAEDTAEVEVDEPLAEPPAETAAPAQKMPSRAPGYIALLFGLAALGLAGYLYYLTQMQDDPLAPFQQRIDELASRAEANSGEVSTQSEALRAELQTALTSQQQQAETLRETMRAEIAAQQDNLEAAQAALAESLGETITAQPPTDRDWKLAEVEYLLRIANHRLLMERDALTAGQLLSAADKIVAEIGDFSLFDVRARLADEILSLKSMTGTDLQGLYLQIEALKNTMDELPLRLPEYLQPKVETEESDVAAAEPANVPIDEQTVWQEMGGRLSAFFQYRKLDGAETRQPLLTPDQTLYLEMNLRLMLERAQLALMRRNQLVYQQSLSNVDEWMADYLENDNLAVAQARGQVAELLDVELELPIPDISGSLTALNAISRGRDE